MQSSQLEKRAEGNGRIACFFVQVSICKDWIDLLEIMPVGTAGWRHDRVVKSGILALQRSPVRHSLHVARAGASFRAVRLGVNHGRLHKYMNIHKNTKLKASMFS